ncbi:MAG: tetratricopeptide repeat protein [Planctomycetota bacterium]|nr:MAG: tetratricopeptide repeat protein [Planctomycetota bacterium]
MLRPCIVLALLPGLTALCACSSAASEEERSRLDDYAARARAYYDSGDLQRAEQQARLGLALDPDDPMLNLLLGRTLLRWQDPEHVAQARPYLEQAHEQQEDHKTLYSLGEYHLRYAELLLLTASGKEQRAQELPSEDAGDSKAIESLNTTASRQRERASQHLQEALELLQAAVASVPTDPYSLRLLANCYTHLQRSNDALATLDQLIQVLAESRQFKNERLALMDLPLPQENALREDLRHDIELEVEARGLAAALLKDRKDYRAAEEQLTAVLKLDPDLEREYFNRGICRYWLGELGPAAEDMQKFLRKTRLGLDSEEVNRALDLIAEYRARSAGAAAASSTPASAGGAAR